MEAHILSFAVASERDVLLVRHHARALATWLGLAPSEQLRLSTAAAHMARVCRRQRSVQASFAQRATAQGNELVVRLHMAPGMPPPNGPECDALAAAGRLVDGSGVDPLAAGGTVAWLCKALPADTVLPAPETLAGQLAARGLADPAHAMQQQDQDMLAVLTELRERQDDLQSLTRELEDTNRGIVALYAEIEDKAERLRRADEMKSRFLSNTSHELRTPLSSIRALAKLLLDRMDGDLTAEQERQVQYIATAANDLSELVNDLLDLAKIEAGKVKVQYAPVVAEHLFRALRGMLRPLVDAARVELVFEPVDARFVSDEGKLAQILRNFIANALKYTEHGEVRVSARLADDGSAIAFTVADTGIGIQPEHLQLIFEEFSQIEHPLQRRSKGTGLGLPLCRKLASLLGGHIDVSSEVGAGSRFTLTVPCAAPPSTLDTDG